MHTYSYADCLQRALKINWKIEDLLKGKSFNTQKKWLPPRLSACDSIEWLTEEEKRKLTHVEMGAYAHIFGYVEEFITPKVVKLAKDQQATEPVAFQALTNFAAEEVKHMTLFHQIREKVNQTLGVDLKLLSGEKETTNFVLSKNELSVVLLIACIEWFTQYHYLSAIKESGDLDPLTKNIFKAHWLEESQHAKMDHNEAIEIFDKMHPEERAEAIRDLIELLKAVDGLLQKQSAYDVENFSEYLGRTFSEKEGQDLYEKILKTKRWVFMESGITHPNFLEIFNYVTTASQRKQVEEALAA